MLTQKSTHWNPRASVHRVTEKSTKRASQFDLKLTREKTKVKFKSISAGIPNITQMGVSASSADTIDDRKILNASV